MQSISAGERHTLASAAERIERSLQSGALTQLDTEDREIVRQALWRIRLVLGSDDPLSMVAERLQSRRRILIIALAAGVLVSVATLLLTAFLLAQGGGG